MAVRAGIHYRVPLMFRRSTRLRASALRLTFVCALAHLGIAAAESPPAAATPVSPPAAPAAKVAPAATVPAAATPVSPPAAAATKVAPAATVPAAATPRTGGAPGVGSLLDERNDLKLGGDGADMAEPEGMGFLLFKMVVVLGIVVLAIYLTLNVGLRRMMGLKGPLGSRGVVQVVERIPLDAKRSMYLLKAAGEYLLIGGGDNALSLICKLDAAEVLRLEQEKAAVSPPVLSPFLQKLLSRRGGS